MRPTDPSCHSAAHDSRAERDHYADDWKKQFQLGKDWVAQSLQIQIGVIGALKVEVYAIGTMVTVEKSASTISTGYSGNPKKFTFRLIYAAFFSTLTGFLLL